MSKQKRKKTGNTVLKVEIPVLLDRILYKISEENNVSVSDIVVQSVTKFVDDYYGLRDDSLKECPRCGAVAHTYSEIEKCFGWRYIKERKQLIPQSHCRECRSEESKLKKQNNVTVENQKSKFPEEGDIVWEIHEQTDNFDDTPYLIASQMYYTSGYSYRLGQDIFLTQKEANEKIQEIYKRVGYK